MTNDFAELCCSNSLRSDQLENAVGLLKEELRRLDSLILACADATRVEAGGALAVDRFGFARLVTEKLRAHPRITVREEEITRLPDEGEVVVASGPLTSEALAEALVQVLGEDTALHFYDAAAPLVSADSVDMVREFFSAIGDLIHHRTSVHTPPARRLLLMVIVATLPLFIILPVKDAIESLYYNTAFIGAALIVTGVLLFFSDRVKRGRKTEKTATILDALIVGLSQVVATCPGISRSGTTICTGMAEFEDVAENVIIIDSVSKRFSSCGARVGMIISRNREMMAQALKMCQGRLCSATLDQIGAAALYSVNPEYFAAVREEYKARRDTIVEKLSAIPGVICKCPKGAFYLMASLPIDDADSFQQWLLEEFEDHGDTVMFAPGEGFYGTPGKGKNEVRLAYVLKQTDLERAMELLALGLQAYNAR